MDKSNNTHEEKRKYPRIKIDSSIDILYKNNEMKARIYDLSPDGLQIRSDKAILQKINPDNLTITEENAPFLDVTFILKLNEIQKKINALCKMHYSEELPNAENENVICGLKFIDFEGDGLKYLDDFITEEMTSV